MSPTVCAPVTNCLGTGLWVYVLGRLGKASFFALAEFKPIGFGLIELPDGATRYARPWRPVKPLLIIWDESARSAAHLAQRRCEVWPLSKDSGLGGLPLSSLSTEGVYGVEAEMAWSSL